MNLIESIKMLNGWYWQDDIWRVILQFLGAICPDFYLEKGLKNLSNSQNLWKIMIQTACEYLTIAGKQICEEKERLGTGRTVRKEEFMSFYVNYEDPPLEIFQSTWQENCLAETNTLPKRVIIFFDIEYYHNLDSTIALLDQNAVFGALEPIYHLVREILLGFGIDHLAVTSGRGYNFVMSVPAESPVFDELLSIGRTINSSIAGKQSYPAFKRTKAVSWQSEQSFKGALRLVMFVTGLIINEARRRSFGLPVEMTDQGIEGISFDLSFFTRGVDTSCFGVPATPYLKLHFQKHLHPEVQYYTPLFVRVIRARGLMENFPDYRKMLAVRSNYNAALDHFAGQEGYIPDASAGIANLLPLYWNSALAKFHKLMDSEDHEPYWDWWRTYRNIDGILNQIPQIIDVIRYPNPKLLQPDSLNYLINEMMNHGWHPKHIGGFIRSFYEDPMLNWGNRFIKYDAAQWADGWVEILGAQRFFGIN